MSPTGTSPAGLRTRTNNRRGGKTGKKKNRVRICHLQKNNAEDAHVTREVTLIVPAVKWGCVSRPAGVKVIYAAELERRCLLPGADCPPAAYFFTSFTRVPEGSLLTEQLLQMDFRLGFTFNSALVARAPPAQQKHCQVCGFFFLLFFFVLP